MRKNFETKMRKIAATLIIFVAFCEDKALARIFGNNFR